MDSVREWNLCAELQHWPTLFLMSFWWRLRFIYTVHVSCALATISIPTLWQQWTRGPTALSFVRFDSSLTLASGVPHYVCKERSLNQACKQQAQGTEMKIVISHHCRIHRKKRWGKKIFVLFRQTSVPPEACVWMFTHCCGENVQKIKSWMQTEPGSLYISFPTVFRRTRL